MARTADVFRMLVGVSLAWCAWCVQGELQKLSVDARPRGPPLDPQALPKISLPPGPFSTKVSGGADFDSSFKDIGISSIVQGAAVPLDLQISATALAEGVAMVRRNVFTDAWGFMYTTSVMVGTPPIKCSLIVDTGSSDLWVKESHKDVRHSASATLYTKTQVHMSYGRGEVDGFRVEDEVCLASVCVHNQSFILADSVRDIGNDAFFDGLLGLAFPALARGSGDTYLQELMSHEFHHLAIGLALVAPTTAYPTGGSLALGELHHVLKDAQAMTGVDKGTTLSVVTFFNEPFWWLVSTVVKVGEPTSPTKPMDRLAMLDSGTSLLTVPLADYQAVVQGMLSERDQARCSDSVPTFEGFLVCPCNIEVRPLIFTFADEDTGEAISVPLTSYDLLVLVGVSSRGDSPMCLIKLAAAPPTLGAMRMWILGDPFLQKVYAVHDVQRSQIHLFHRDAAEHSWPFTAFRPASGWWPPISTTLSDGDRIGAIAALGLFALLVCSYLRGRRSRARALPDSSSADLGIGDVPYAPM